MEFWFEVQKKMSEKISKPSYETWLANTTAECLDEVVFVKAKNDFQADWLDSRYKLLISQTVAEVTGKSMDIVIVGEHPVLERNQYQDSTSSSNGHDVIIHLLKEQQQRINELEDRINRLEKNSKG